MLSQTHSNWFRATAIVCSILLVPGQMPSQQQTPTPAAPPAAPAKPEEAKPDAPPKTAGELDSIVAPIALYPDPLLAQILASSTYPLEIVQARRWMLANPKLKGEELTKGAQKQPWDPSVQALVAFPDALKLLDENLKWTTSLGDAFLEQQSEVMDAVQRMRKKAKDSGKLDSSKEQKVEVKTVESKTIIEIQPSNPEVIYVPSYNPVVVYGAAPVYAYPPIAYPSTGAIVATAAISFGVGVAMGAFWGGCCGGGGWGWGCGWGGGGGNNTININNNFNNRYGYNNIQGGNRTNIGNGNSSWNHNPAHRQSVPYSNRKTAQQFGGGTRAQGGGLERFDGNGQTRNTAGQIDRGGQNRGAQAGTRDVNSGRDGAQAGTRDVGGSDKIGNRSIDSSNRSSSGSALGGSESKARTQSSSDRGFSSTRSSPSRSSSSGSMSRGGGGGMSRGGGGGRRR